MLVKLDDSNWVDAASVRRVHCSLNLMSKTVSVYVTTDGGTEHWCGEFKEAEGFLAAARIATEINRALET